MKESKSFFRKASSSIVCFFTFFLLVCFCECGFAQALDGLAGRTVILSIKSGTSPFANSGRVAIALSGVDNTYRSYGLAPVVTDSSGTFAYTKTNGTTGVLVLNDVLGVETASFTFNTPSSGFYTTTLGGTSSKQTGTFFLLSNSVPVAIAGKVYDSVITGGKAPFAISGHFRLFLEDGTYTIKNIKGAKDSSGTYAASAINGSGLALDLTDSITGNGIGFLGFSNLTTGFYVFKTASGYQSGRFHEVLPPAIIKSPTDLSVVVNRPTLLAVRATGEGPIKYQWFLNGSPITKATNAILAIPSTKATNAGNYYVTVSNDGGATNSNEFNLSLIFPPSITVQPIGQTNPVSSTIVLSAAATGTEPLRYQWQFKGINMAGKTNSSLTVTNSKLSNSGFYRLIVRNAAGAAISSQARVLVLTPVQIASGPRGYLANTNANVLLSVVATGSAPLHYQWQLNGGDIVGATKAQYIVNKVSSTNVGNYSVVVSNLVSSTNLSALVAVTTSPFDPNDDGQTDLLIQASDGKLITWFLSSTNFLKSIVLNHGKSIDSGLRVGAVGDFNHDGKKDLLIQNTNSGALSIWLMNGTNFVGTNMLSNVVPSAWKVVSAADFDNNGSLDLLTQNSTNGLTAIWLMDGTNFLNTKPIVLVCFDQRYGVWTALGSPELSVVGTGDLRSNPSNPSPDILFQSKADGLLAFWQMDPANFATQTIETNFTVFQYNAALYLDESNFVTLDLDTNYLVSIPASGFTIYSADGVHRYAPGAAWKAVAIADFNFDGKQDVIFENDNGQLGIMYQTFGFVLGAADLRNRQPITRSWRIVGPR